MRSNGRKRLFLGLVLANLLLLALAALVVWYVIGSDTSVGRWLGNIVLVLAMVALVYALLATISLAASLLRGRNTGFLARTREQVVFALLPIVLRLGEWLGLERDRIRASFIEVNNQIVDQKHVHANPDELLILAPVCLQEANCTRKITYDIENCRQCGRCPVGGLLRLAHDYQVSLAIATGGTKARQLLQELRPRVVVAIACERDLVSGLQDARAVIVKGITNQRPNGPCFNTQVDLEEVEGALKNFLGSPDPRTV